MPVLSEKEMQWFKGGDHYHVNQSGEIMLVQQTSDSFDRLGAYNGEYIDVGKGILSQFTSGSGIFHGSVNVDNIFGFVSQNTDVEWSMTRYKDETGTWKFYLGTNNSPTNVSGYIPQNGTDISVVHNHPGIPSGLLEPSPEDLEISRQNPSVIFEIRGGNQVVRYQNGMIIRD